MPRNNSEWAMDHLLLLYICQKVQNSKEHQLHNLIHRVQSKLIREGFEGLHYKFTKSQVGPISIELKYDLRRLQDANLLTPDYSLGSQGRDIIDNAKDILYRNTDVLKIISHSIVTADNNGIQTLVPFQITENEIKDLANKFDIKNLRDEFISPPNRDYIEESMGSLP